MTARKKTSPKTKSSVARKRRQARKQSHALNFEALESRQLLAAVTVGNTTDILSPTADTSSIAALVANDGGDGISLREAIAAANNTAGEDSITFDAGVFTGDNNLIRLTQGQLSISDSLTVDGSSAGGVVITGDAAGDDITLVGTDITDVSASFVQFSGPDLLGDNSRVLDFSGSGDLALTGLTITGGRETATNAGGGGIRFNSSGALTLDQSTVAGNSSEDGSGIYSSSGTVSLTNSTVSRNVGVAGSGGNVGNGGGLFISNGNLSLTNTTVSGNRTNGFGGGISSTNSTVLLINSTVVENATSTFFQKNGSGIAFSANAPIAASLTIHNSIVADNGQGYYTSDLLVSGDATSDDLTVEYLSLIHI